MLELLLITLATYRLAHAVVNEDGPADAFIHLRTFAYNRWRGSWVDVGVNCILCVSFWAAWLVVALPAFAQYALAAAGLILVCHQVARGWNQ